VDIDADTPSWYRPPAEEARAHPVLSGSQFKRRVQTGVSMLKMGMVGATFAVGGMSGAMHHGGVDGSLNMEHPDYTPHVSTIHTGGDQINNFI
jgi:hypothetical protein